MTLKGHDSGKPFRRVWHLADRASYVSGMLPLPPHTLAPMKFEIVYIFEKQRPVTLFARQLDAGVFTLSDSPMLGGVPIKRYVSQPRALKPNGEPDVTQFSFVLSTASDLPKLRVGQVVELT